MKTTNWEFDRYEEMEGIFNGGDNLEFSKLVIDYCIHYSKQESWEKEIILNIIVKEDKLMYDIILQKSDLKITLESNIKILEKYEEYEYCQRALDVLNTL